MFTSASCLVCPYVCLSVMVTAVVTMVVVWRLFVCLLITSKPLIGEEHSVFLLYIKKSYDMSHETMWYCVVRKGCGFLWDGRVDMDYNNNNKNNSNSKRILNSDEECPCGIQQNTHGI